MPFLVLASVRNHKRIEHFCYWCFSDGHKKAELNQIVNNWQGLFFVFLMCHSFHLCILLEHFSDLIKSWSEY